MKIDKLQTEMSLAIKPAKRKRVSRELAAWWFRLMRHVVANTPTWDELQKGARQQSDFRFN